jgi:hypothetical protein
MESNNEPIRSLCEQGDMGLYGTPLSEADQKAYLEQLKKKQQQESEDNK